MASSQGPIPNNVIEDIPGQKGEVGKRGMEDLFSPTLYRLVISTITTSQPLSLSLKILLFFFFQGCTHPQHMDIPRLGLKLELQLLAYTAATATPDLSCVCNL